MIMTFFYNEDLVLWVLLFYEECSVFDTALDLRIDMHSVLLSLRWVPCGTVSSVL